MKHRALVACAVTVALGFTVAACGSDDTSSSGSSKSSSSPSSSQKKPTVGVILPDTASSARWEGADRPLLQQAFQAAGVDADIQNANGDKAKFGTICDQMIYEGAKVL
jgi:D-xylose transport system substrate-binding protein